MQYRPPNDLGLRIGGLLTLGALALALLLLALGVKRELGFTGWLAYCGAAVSVAVALLFGYWTWALETLTYHLDRNALLIRWGHTQQVIPLGSIERLVPASAVGLPQVRGVVWWGSQIGRGEVASLGSVLCYATDRAPEEMLYVVTPRQTYAISVTDPQEFARQVLIRQELGPTAQLEHQARRTGPQALLTDDRLGLALTGLAIAGGALVWLQLALRHGSVPATLPLHVLASEAADIVTRPALLEIGRSASVILVIGLVLGLLVHGRDRFAGRLVLAAAVVVQAIFLAATAIAIG